MRVVLVVEADAIMSEGIRTTLEKEGFHVDIVTDAMSALDWLAHNRPDAILSDIMMPGMNGYQFYQRLRRNPAWVWIPFIFLTDKNGREDIRYAKEMGVDDYLIKPFEPEDLAAAVWGRLVRYDQLQPGRKSKQLHGRPTGRFGVGRVEVDFSRCQVNVSGRDVQLSSTEFDILQRLILEGGAVVPYQYLLNSDDGELLGDRDAAELSRYHIRSIRQKIKEAGEDHDVIANVRSVGYRLNGEPYPLP